MWMLCRIVEIIFYHPPKFLICETIIKRNITGTTCCVIWIPLTQYFVPYVISPFTGRMGSEWIEDKSRSKRTRKIINSHWNSDNWTIYDLIFWNSQKLPLFPSSLNYKQLVSSQLKKFDAFDLFLYILRAPIHVLIVHHVFLIVNKTRPNYT